MVSNSYNEKAAASCGIPATQESTIGARLSGLESACRRLDGSIIRLGNKLESVLAPSNPCKDSGACPPNPPMSNMASQLSAYVDMICMFEARIDDLIARVEL